MGQCTPAPDMQLWHSFTKRCLDAERIYIRRLPPELKSESVFLPDEDFYIFTAKAVVDIANIGSPFQSFISYGAHNGEAFGLGEIFNLVFKRIAQR